ncbi:MAG: hypothetical protein COU32_03610 [Candidatus Magasanikbacteria bacterium CG10_big_fil_rev_8_21_14_0_10_42_10]|uniref:ATP-grasp domain-containing protein n=2 Tax=Candidatus Magasanikiibacteriota TaxID=1752731 RepID=A0A2H0TXM3_9BACT|nr:MAG: hypothetical protein COU32_03610 [Candidatus Magasanikbacteria bacterium CG10_big_fil_rev_8_21_14_0_10_42_10]PIZ94397.1 MAG: hypothetical protein COX82_00730 [Candidatus Magasanikbacteria bacterium CG_4_10_14_0_2_um_filter_41_10]
MSRTKEYILFITNISKRGTVAVKKYNETMGKNYQIIVIRDKNKKNWDKVAEKRNIYKLLTCDFNSPQSIERSLAPYKTSIKAATFYGDVNAPFAKKIVPHIPFVLMPTAQSLEWATDKIAMRQFFEVHDKTITPPFIVVKDADEKSIEQIIKKIGFPLVIKPAGLAASLLVTMCYHEDELRSSLKKTLRKVKKIYLENKRSIAPKILVEQFMEGDMYSIDAYVDRHGHAQFCPLVYVKTGKAIGFDDFFGYLRLTPTQLKESTKEKAEHVAMKAIQALNLRSTIAHIELMRTEEGWKIIELGPRMGGFRHDMYVLSYGIDHDMNDLRIHLGEKPIIPKKLKSYVAVLQFFAKKEGQLQKIKGVRKITAVASLKEMDIHIKPGEKCLFAKHGGKSVCDIVLSNINRSELLADIRRIEQMIDIQAI